MKNRTLLPIKQFIIPLLLLMFSISILGQNNKLLNINTLNSSGDVNLNILTARQTSYLRSIYSEKIEATKELINGKEFEPYYAKSKIKPLLYSDKKRTASIITNTRRYNNLTLQYDTFLDEVIYTDITRIVNFRFPMIALNKDIIDGFNLYFEDDSLIFRYFRLSDCIGKNLKEGFYEVVYDGKSKYIIRHESSFYEREGLDNYKYSPKNYISVGDAYYRIKNRKSLLRLCGGKSLEIKVFLHTAGIKMRKADKSQILTVLKFYDSLL